MKILRNFLRSLFGNIPAYLLSAFIAVVIWFAISLQIFPDVTTHILNIPVQIQPTDYMQREDLQLAEKYDLMTSVQVQGKRYDIGKLTSDDFDAYLDLSDITTDGEKEVLIKINAKDVTKCEILPAVHTAKIKIEKIATKTFDIQVKAENISVVEGFLIDTVNLSANPPTVTITGEKKLVDSITRAEVNTVYDGEILLSTEVKGELTLFNNNVKVDNPDLILDNNYFTVTVPIHKIKTLPLYFKITNYSSNFDINNLLEKIVIRPSELTISSPDNSIDTLSELNIGSMALSDITYQFMQSPKFFTVAQFLVEGYKNISNQTACTLEFTDIDDYTSLLFTVPNDNFTIINQPSNLEAQLLTKELTLTVVGPTAFVQALSIDDISITVNLLGSEISEGLKTLTATCRINGESVPAWVVENPKVDINFTAIKDSEQTLG